MKNKPKPKPAAKQQPQKASRRGRWWVRNIAAAVLTALVLPQLLRLNYAQEWLMFGYGWGNHTLAKNNSHLTNDERLMGKLGNDYAYLLFLRQRTPADAVILYPSRQDFIDSIDGYPSMFKGNLCDKLAVVRVLYPRHVVMPDEVGKTSWSRRIDYVAIVNRHGLQYIEYPVDSNYVTGVLPRRLPRGLDKQ